MVSEETKTAVLEMHRKGISIKKIRDLLKIAKNTVRSIIRGDHDGKSHKTSRYESHMDLIKEIYPRCLGNAVRIQEVLEEQYQVNIPYTTLTWMIRQMDLREGKKPVGIYTFEPGAEMQHDTSIYTLPFEKRPAKGTCASLILANSRKLYIQFYPGFTRFEARIFLKDGFEYLDGTCPRCTIDNTSVLVANGAGPDATIAPEIKHLGDIYQVTFIPHRVGDPDRKGRVERPFSYVENNFLAGRVFKDWEDLNKQAVNWCDTIANFKIKRVLGMSPNQAYILEKPYLTPLPVYSPPIYMTLYRVVDTQGYVHIDTNRYSAPYLLIGKQVEVQKHLSKIVIYHKHEKIAVHNRVLENKDARVTDPAHLWQGQKKAKNEPLQEERLLKGEDAVLDQYIEELKKRSFGRGAAKLKRLLTLKRTYPQEAFIAAIKTALQYGLYDLYRIENIILSNISGSFFEL
jgi:transposase